MPVPAHGKMRDVGGLASLRLDLGLFWRLVSPVQFCQDSAEAHQSAVRPSTRLIPRARVGGAHAQHGTRRYRALV